MLVNNKTSDDSSVVPWKSQLNNLIPKITPQIDKLPLYFYKIQSDVTWSCNWLSDDIVRNINRINPNIVNLHWIGRGLLQNHGTFSNKTTIDMDFA